MASINNYISVLSPVTDDEDDEDTGELTLQIKTSNKTPSQSLDVTITGLTGDLTEAEIAEAIKDQINAALDDDGKLYTGSPYFTSEAPFPWKLRAIQCDHIVNIWSQTGFSIKEKTNNIGTKLIIGAEPVFVTIAEAEAMSGVVGAKFKHVNGTPYDESEKAEALKAASNYVISYADGNVFVATQYLHEEVGTGQWVVRMWHDNVIMNDFPRFNKPGFFWANGDGSMLTTGFEIDSDGYLCFSEDAWCDTPLIPGVFMKMTYIAGQESVPSILKQECCRVVGYMRVPSQYSKLKGASFSIEYKDQGKLSAEVIANLARIV